MMELNCTHEESKKILELGYDFSKVCDRFIEELTRLKKPEYIEREYFDIVVFRSEVDQHIKDSWIPIIPYDALAKCLPDLEEERHIKNARVWLGKDLYLTSEDCIYSGDIDGDGVGYGSYFLERLKDQEFKNAYKAFVWCHEKYPEELRAKFEEVMK